MVKMKVNLTFDFHARPATFFVNETMQYTSDIHLCHSHQKANGKSILSVMTLEVIRGDIIDLIIDGADEQKAKEGLQRFFLTYKDE